MKAFFRNARSEPRDYLHDDEEDECEEDVDLGVFPGVVMAVVVELLGDALAAPGAVVKQGDQRLVLRQLKGRREDLLSFVDTTYFPIVHVTVSAR